MSNTQTVTIAQALASNQSNLQVVDTAANIVGALPNAGLVGRVASFTLSAAATLAVAAEGKLAGLGAKFHLGGFQLTVADAAYNLLSAPAGWFSLVAHVTLTGNPTLNAAQLTKLESLPGFTVAPGAQVTLSDSLANVAADAIPTPMSAATNGAMSSQPIMP